MKKKQVMVLLLAASLAVGNIAVGTPNTVWADQVSTDPAVSSNDVKKLEDETLWTNKSDISLVTSVDGAKLGATKDAAEAENATNSAAVTVGSGESENVSYWYKGQSDTNATEKKLTIKTDTTAPVISALTADSESILPASETDEQPMILKAAPAEIKATAADAEGEVGCAESGYIKYVVGTELKNAEEMAAIQKGEWQETATLKEGPNYVYVKAEDQLGNAAYVCSKKIVLDTTIVAGTLTLGEDSPITASGSYTKPTETQSYNSAEQLTVVLANPAEKEGTTYATPQYLVSDTALEESALESQEWTAYEEPIPVENGTYIYARFSDAAGNISYAVTKKMVAVAVPAFTVSIEASTEGEGEALVLLDGQEGVYDLKNGKAPAVKVAADAENSLDGWTVYYKDLTVESSDFVEMTNGTVTINTKGPHEIECYIKNGDGLMSPSQTINFTNMVDPAIAFTSTEPQTFTGSPANVETLGATNTASADITYKFYSDAAAENEIEVPVNAGTYYVKAFVAQDIASGVLAAESDAVAFTINAMAQETDTYKNIATEQYVSGGASADIDLSELVAAYMIDGDVPSYGVEDKAGATSELIESAEVGASDGKFKFTFAADKTVSEDTDVAFTINVSGLANYTKLVLTVNAKITKDEVVAINIAQDDFTYNGDAAALKVTLADGTEIDPSKLTKVSFTKEGASDVEEAKNAGTYTYTVKYTDTIEEKTVVGYATKTFTIAKKAIEFKASDVTITKGSDLPATYTFTPAKDCLVTGDTWATEPSATCDDADKDTVGTYTITMSAGAVDGEAAGNYDLTAVNGTLTVKAAETRPSVPDYSGGGAAPTTPDKTDDKKDDTTTTPSDTAISNTVVKDASVSADGTITDKDGKPVANAIVETADGKNYITGADGKALTDQVVATADGSKYALAKDGTVVKSATVTIEGVKYLATEDGTVATNGFYKTPKGNLVYANKEGALKTDDVFKVDGKKYVAKKTGAIVISAFSKTEKGNTVYSGKNGAIVTNKAFKVGGKTYVAKKSGALVKKAWITIGNKSYYCNKNGVVTKIKKVK
ncbi:MAG: hypothetical protein PUK75_14885 [bacterium]|nr:hypothetical protein [bacterium]MDY4100407.1 hypothetical protein [Lachnospiraceae bacterium]